MTAYTGMLIDGRAGFVARFFFLGGMEIESFLFLRMDTTNGAKIQIENRLYLKALNTCLFYAHFRIIFLMISVKDFIARQRFHKKPVSLMESLKNLKSFR